MRIITRGNVKAAFEHLCKALGKRIATSYNDVGAWRLDYYNGYAIEEIDNEQGGVSHPFMERRMTTSEFYDAAWMAIRAVEILERDRGLK